jgi:acyl-CoA thioesterase
MQSHEIVNKMMDGDAFSQWLGITILNLNEGTCTLEMTTRPEMVNGFGILHGGITYSLADSALAFASNSQGKHAVSIETSISHLAKVVVNEQLVAIAKEISMSNRIAVYEVKITNERHELVALFKGTVYRMKEW